MNTELFMKITNYLLATHYGIGTHDTGIDERSIVECIKNNIRPYEEVNTLAREYGLDRIGVDDRQWNWLVYFEGILDRNAIHRLCNQLGNRYRNRLGNRWICYGVAVTE